MVFKLIFCKNQLKFRETEIKEVNYLIEYNKNLIRLYRIIYSHVITSSFYFPVILTEEIKWNPVKIKRFKRIKFKVIAILTENRIIFTKQEELFI